MKTAIRNEALFSALLIWLEMYVNVRGTLVNVYIITTFFLKLKPPNRTSPIKGTNT
ncbi:hypothetical protein Scep_009327 [Stephania cephalantha]|uniref:Uncharacterized protein n=1 Tax=Stephania cephalantha TaxID=152367 RepID=A0AAP0PG61_9MAGN